MNKKALNIFIGTIVFIVLIIIFISGLIYAVARAGSQAPLYEQAYAKQIVLIINKAEPGMNIEIDLFDLYNLAEKNKYDGQLINIDNNNNKINVKLTNGNGYNYYYFNDVKISWNINSENKKLHLDIFEKIRDENGIKK